jgi:RNA polymerase sigma factor for flagellar operon FliA
MDGTACREIDQTIKDGIDLKTTRILWQKFRKENNEEERNKLIEKYLPLVQRIAEKVAAKLPHSVDSQDLQSAGIFGLMHAIRGFDMNRGVRFETYCASRIRGAILDELRQIDWVPRLVRTRSNKLDHAQRDLERELGRKPDSDELAERMNVSVENIEEMIREARPLNIVSLNTDLPEKDENKAYRKLDFLEDKQAPDPFENINRRDLMDLVSKGLSREERLVLLLYYYEQLTMKEIGMVLDVTESRVCQIHTQIIDKLRRRLARRKEEFPE